MSAAYEELETAAKRVVELLKRYEVAISTGDVSTRGNSPIADRTHPTGRLMETTTLAAARAYVNAEQSFASYMSTDERDAAVDNAARLVAAKPEFRAAVKAAIQMVLSR